MVAGQDVHAPSYEAGLVLRLRGRGEVHDGGEPVDALQALEPLCQRGEHTQRVLLVVHERLHLGLARAGLREDGLVLVDEVALGGVIDGRVGDGHRRHRHRVGDEYGHGRLDAEPTGEGHPRHVAELLGQDRVGGVGVDPEALGEVPPFLLVAERGHRDTAHALRHVRDLLPPARAGRSGGLGDLLTPQLDAVPQARHTTGEALHRLHGIDQHVDGRRDRARDRPARCLGKFLRLAHVVELGQGVDLLHPNLEHVDAMGLEGAVVRANREVREEPLHRDAVVHGEVGALEQLGSDQVLRLEHGLRLEARLAPRSHHRSAHDKDGDHRNG